MKKIKTWHIILTIVLVLTVAAAAVSLFAPEVFKPVKELFTGKDEGAADNSGKAVKDSNQGSSGETTATVTDPADDGTGDTAATGDNAVGSGEVGSGSYGAEVGGTDLSGYSELFSMYASSMAESPSVESVDLPESETMLSLQLAREALTLCSGGTKTGQAGVLMNSGFEVLLQSGYDKAADDVSHT
ncbi:MAG: hypothetical protein J5728_01380, partial [Lachnospiraceae bacterium]|nr:hypothetical protein [Lachnospiraceae bacterium]